MRDDWNRQRSALAAALCSWMCGVPALAESATHSTPAHELQAAKLLEMAVLADGPNPEEQKKLRVVYRDLVARNPKDASIRNAFAEFLWSTDDRSGAVEQWQAAERLDPKDGIVLTHLGGAFTGAGQTRKGVHYYARAAASAPENGSFQFNLGNATFLFRHELIDPAMPSSEAVAKRALFYFSEAARLEPLNPEFARAYAETFYSFTAPDWKVALAAWQHFLQISPQKNFALGNLARVYLKLGEKEEARACVAKMEGVEAQRLKARLMERIDED
jgi:tetratricopeptide (TPR) repeat protein